MKEWIRQRLSRHGRLAPAVLGVAFLAACATVGVGVTSSEWKTNAIPQSQGIVKEVDGKRIQQRYPYGGFGTVNFEKWPTFAANSPAYFPPKKGEMPKDVKGDPKKGQALMKNASKGPCTACHLIPDATVWPAGNVGPDLRTSGSRGVPDEIFYQIIYDPRVIYGPDTPMAPFGASGMWTPEEIVHAVAYIQSLKGNPPGVAEEVSKDPDWNPYTRKVVRPAYGDPLDPIANPGLGQAESLAVPRWSKTGPKGQSCANCHGPIAAPDAKRSIGVITSMVGVGAQYPKWMPQHKRMMSIEDFLAVHAPETTGDAMPSQGDENLSMSILVKMQSNGMPYNIALDDRNVQAAIARGEEMFSRRVGQRGQACANCHTARGGGRKFLGGRFLADIEEDAMVNHPYWRTAWQRLIDIRIRFQWCMTPLRTNMLPGDAPEYADLETFIIAKQTRRGDKVEVPRLSH
ncbi:MAG: sulfur oxidation c-type cytochrome SoxA [Betaproteobacteria bacterium]|nr:sulfur oxidation c-type cytochrome SoxA [Betaproteobacteria bacterium]